MVRRLMARDLRREVYQTINPLSKRVFVLEGDYERLSEDCESRADEARAE